MNEVRIKKLNYFYYKYPVIFAFLRKAKMPPLFYKRGIKNNAFLLHKRGIKNNAFLYTYKGN